MLKTGFPKSMEKGWRMTSAHVRGGIITEMGFS